MIIFEERSQILDQVKYREEIETSIRQSKKEIIIISAFVKKIGLDWMQSIVPDDVNVTVIARFLPQDILMQSSDLEVYEICKKNGWIFKCITELHAKVILIDETHLFVGSQNLTGKGMGIVCNPNLEYGMMTVPTKNEVEIINSLVEQSLEMNDFVFDEFKEWLSKKKQDFKLPSFNNNPLKKYQVFDYKNIWCRDFPVLNLEQFLNNFSLTDQNVINVKEIFLIDLSLSKEDFIKNYDSFIVGSKIYNWIKKQAQKDNNQIFFGKLSELIHNSVRDDPSPNRRMVKYLQANFYTFLKNLSNSLLTIDIPYSRSERIVFNI